MLTAIKNDKIVKFGYRFVFRVAYYIYDNIADSNTLSQSIPCYSLMKFSDPACYELAYKRRGFSSTTIPAQETMTLSNPDHK